MQTIEYRTMDKTAWGEGPWQNEPDKKQWVDKATGLPCLIVRNRQGALCGYVGVPASHPCYGKDYDSVDVDVHGGLTFAAKCDDGKECESICHRVEPGEDDNVWWLGFDCLHCFDLAPGGAAWERENLPGSYRDDHKTYRTVAYVERQVGKLAKQLATTT